MNKLILTFLIVINLISIYQCLGITNYTKLGNYYIINIASEDITNFKNKLNSNLHSIKNEFSLIIIKVFLRTVALYIYKEDYFDKILYDIFFYYFNLRYLLYK